MSAKTITALQGLTHPAGSYRPDTGKTLPGQTIPKVTPYSLVALAVALIADVAIGFMVKPSHEVG